MCMGIVFSDFRDFWCLKEIFVEGAGRFGKRFIHLNTNLVSADARIFQPLKRSHLVCTL